jgi:hypothetical protein
MTWPWRVWVLLLTMLAAFATAFGMQPGMATAWWPVAGIWLATGLASFGLSIWAAICLTLLGIFMDFMGEAPIGAWPLALLSAYGVALVAWDRQATSGVPVVMAEVVAVVGGLVAAGVALGLAAGIAGHPAFSRPGFMTDFLLTALLYPLARYLVVPGSIREARR